LLQVGFRLAQVARKPQTLKKATPENQKKTPKKQDGTTDAPCFFLLWLADLLHGQVWTHAAIHEFADSQFGHLFARGEDREEARKTLVPWLRWRDGRMGLG